MYFRLYSLTGLQQSLVRLKFMRHTIILSDVIALKSLPLDRPMGAGQEIKQHKYCCFWVIGFKMNVQTKQLMLSML